MKPISANFKTPPINTELTEPDVSNQVSGVKIQAHVVLQPEVSNERLLMKDLMQTFYMLLVMNI